MKRLLPVLLAFAATLAVPGQSIGPPASTMSESAPAAAPPAPASTPSSKSGHPSNAALQAAIERLTRSNEELLDLLKQQQSVLEDIQYDRRLQNRQISLLEQRLEDTLQLNASLQAKVAGLQAQVADGASAEKSSAADHADTAAPADTIPAVVAPAPPPPPASYLPPEESTGPPGTMWWHRLFTLSGTDSQNSQTFQISGKQWRVLWHNQDKPGDTYKNTSALFINAFPSGDPIPKKVCSQLGTGEDNTELTGTGEFYLKVEASGGHWELAVEDFR